MTKNTSGHPNTSTTQNNSDGKFDQNLKQTGPNPDTPHTKSKANHIEEPEQEPETEENFPDWGDILEQEAKDNPPDQNNMEHFWGFEAELDGILVPKDLEDNDEEQEEENSQPDQHDTEYPENFADLDGIPFPNDPEDNEENETHWHQKPACPAIKTLTQTTSKSFLKPMPPITSPAPAETQPSEQPHLLLQDLTQDSIKEIKDVLNRLKSFNGTKEITFILNGTEGDIQQTETLIQFLRLPPKITTTTILLNHAKGPLAALLLAGHRIGAHKTASLQIHAPSFSNQDHIFWRTVTATAQTLLPNLILRLQEKIPLQPATNDKQPNLSLKNMDAWENPAHAIIEPTHAHLTKSGKLTWDQIAALQKLTANYKPLPTKNPQLTHLINKLTNHPPSFTNPFDIYSIIRKRWATALHKLQTPPPPNLQELRHKLTPPCQKNNENPQNPEEGSKTLDAVKNRRLTELWHLALCLAFVLHQTSATLTAPDAFHLGLVHALINDDENPD
jgi:hypothetical protein